MSKIETVVLPNVPIVTLASKVDKVTEKCSVLSTTSSSIIVTANCCTGENPGLNITSELTIALKSDGHNAVPWFVENLQNFAIRFTNNKI